MKYNVSFAIFVMLSGAAHAQTITEQRALALVPALEASLGQKATSGAEEGYCFHDAFCQINFGYNSVQIIGPNAIDVLRDPDSDPAVYVAICATVLAELSAAPFDQALDVMVDAFKRGTEDGPFKGSAGDTQISINAQSGGLLECGFSQT